MDTEAVIEAGHTYFPNADVADGNRLTLWLNDNGSGYPRECNPSRMGQPLNQFPKEKCRGPEPSLQ